MARSSSRHKPALESLESRKVLSGVGPSDQAQYMLEVLNLARTQPAATAQWVRDKADSTVQANLGFYGVSLDDAARAVASSRPQQPLAWNDQLAAAARNQSGDMAAKGYQSHEQPNNPGSRTLEQRLDNAGYGNRGGYAENAFAYARPRGRTLSASDADQVQAVDNAMQAFLIDWGVAGAPHRNNIQQPTADDASAYGEVGIGINDVTDPGLLARNFGPKVVTQVFGRQNGNGPKVLGVVFEDVDRDGRFSYKEGRGDVRITIENLDTGSVETLTNWNAGGYQESVAPGRYRVTAQRGGQNLGTTEIRVGSQNVKVDFQVRQGAPEAAQTVKLPAETPQRRNRAAEAPRPTPEPRNVVRNPEPRREEAAPAVVVTPTRPTISRSTLLQASFDPAQRVVAAAETAPFVFQITRESTPAPAPVTVAAPEPAAPVVTAAAVTENKPVRNEIPASAIPSIRTWASSRIVWGQGWKAWS